MENIEWNQKVWVQIPALVQLWLGWSLHLPEADFFFCGVIETKWVSKIPYKMFKNVFQVWAKLMHWWPKWNLWDVISKWSKTKSSVMQSYLVVGWCSENKTLWRRLFPSQRCASTSPCLRGSAWFQDDWSQSVHLSLSSLVNCLVYTCRAKKRGVRSVKFKSAQHCSWSLVPSVCEDWA